MTPLRDVMECGTLADMIVATVNQKGGVGKSTIAVHLVTWLRDRGIDAGLVDADPQASSSVWAKEVDHATPVHRMSSVDDILDRVRGLPETAKVIDVPPGLGEVSRATMLVSDVALIPCGPSVLDLRAAHEAIRVLEQVHQIRGELPKGAFVPNKLQRNYRLSRELLLTADSLGLEVAPALGLRQAFADAAGQKTVVWRMKQQAAAGAEMTRLFEHLFLN
jgi:chromosome partitioning protein